MFFKFQSDDINPQSIETQGIAGYKKNFAPT